jgi:hypothetical protein
MNAPGKAEMLTIPGPPPVNAVQRSDESNLFLRVNQKVAGEILSVANDQVVLSIQGVQVVARLTTPEQMVELADRRFAQFVVKDASQGTVLLQVVEADVKLSSPEVKALTQRSEPELIGGLLKQLGLVSDETNKIIAHQLIRQGMQLTPETMNEIRTAIAGLKNPTENDIHQAVQLKALGVPVSPEAIELMNKGPAEITRTITSLVRQLQYLTDLPENLREPVANAIRILTQAVLQGEKPAAELIQSLKNSVTLLGKTVENELLKNTIQPGGSELELGLIALSRLRTELASRGNASIAGDIDRLNDYLRLVHLPNAEPSSPTANNQWFRLEIPVQYPVPTGQQLQEDLHPARIKVAREQDENGSHVDPRYTRIVVQVDLGPGQTVEVDLSIVSKQIGLSVTTTSEFLRQAAENELPQLKDDLDGLGYQTKYSHIEKGQVTNKEDSIQIPSEALIQGNIDVEV